MSTTTDPRTEQTWLVEVFVTLKPAVNDPQGLAIQGGLHMLGYNEVGEVRAGKYMQLEVFGDDKSLVETRVQEMCEKLLANTVIESYRFDVRPAANDTSQDA